nr:hypothetical protein [uncultured Mediterranean phage uvMED]BAR25736.1 hypothetical protein [uncultured Mediterranean phage uvMED]
MVEENKTVFTYKGKDYKKLELSEEQLKLVNRLKVAEDTMQKISSEYNTFLMLEDYMKILSNRLSDTLNEKIELGVKDDK